MRIPRALALVAGLVVGAVTDIRAIDVPIVGKGASLNARRAAHRTFAFRSGITPVIATPFPDPTIGAALRVFVSSGPGQCHAEIVLPTTFWTAIGGTGTQKGWRYRDPAGSAGGLRAVTLSSRAGGGRLTVKARGEFPCLLEAPQAAPLRVELRLGGTRYCAAFGGTVGTNEAGRYRATDALAPTACLDDDVTVASLNVLHGLFCPAGTAGCRRSDRIALVAQFVVARGCPDVLAFQEIFDLGAGNENAQTLAAALTNVCPAPYVAIYHRANPVDDEMILSRHPVLVDETVPLLGPLRNVLHVRIDHPIGALDVYATHLASGSDLATSPCAGTFGPCPSECVSAGAATVRECQAVQMANLIASTHDVPAPALALGDFNADPTSFEYATFTARGWIDTYLAAGNAECVPATGVGCTSGRIDDALTDMEQAALAQTERIDYAWLVPATTGSLCSATVEAAGDPDGDGVATTLFADTPNPFTTACGPLPDAICWASDHTGVQADIDCH